MSDLATLTQQALDEVAASTTLAALGEVRVHWLGKKGLLTEQLKSLGALPAAERPAVGAKINDAKQVVQAAIEAAESKLAAAEVEAADVVIDADGATAIPGLIDSQVHNTFGDYTPRQKTVGFLESYVHGGVTTAISASEVHVPGRPKDPEGVKALADAAMTGFEPSRPGGKRV